MTNLQSNHNVHHGGGLVADLLPNLKLMRLFGHFLFSYHGKPAAGGLGRGGGRSVLHVAYASLHLLLSVVQFGLLVVNLYLESNDVNDLAANTITVLFFLHCLTKLAYFAVRSRLFHRTLAVWNKANAHPLFAESDARYRLASLRKMRRVLWVVATGTALSLLGWVALTFLGDSVRLLPPQEANDTLATPTAPPATAPLPRLLVRSWYPMDVMQGWGHLAALAYQVYWVLFSMAQANLLDLLFCSWLIFACEQLQHLKEILKPLMELSSALDTYQPNSADLFKGAKEDGLNSTVIEDLETSDVGMLGIRREIMGATTNFRAGSLQTFGPNGLTKKQEMLVRSAIKYWVERHKHVVRLVTAIGDAYGIALLLHMLTSTITLTLLAYQATKISGVDGYAASVLGYLFYTLAQVFLFCIFGNRLIEESSSVMEAAYSCHWYDGSEESKTFIQIVCQQCQKAMSISGAKFFTISLDLFASVLGAFVTYFMVLVQLK